MAQRQWQWPAGRPHVRGFVAECELAILAVLEQAYRCVRALLDLVRDSFDEVEDDGGGGALSGGVSVGHRGWPAALPPVLASPADFVVLAAACRALETWTMDADWDMQSAAGEHPSKRQLLETAGWWMTRCSQAALHVAALAVGAAGGLWARDAALHVLRGACGDLSDAISTMPRPAA